MKKGQTCYGTINGSKYQVALFPMEYIGITQTPWGDVSHYCSKNGGNSGLWDVNGGGGKQAIYAPFDCTRKAFYSVKSSLYNGNQCILQSDNKVIYADGSLDYAYFGFGHDGRYTDCPTSCCQALDQTEAPIISYTTHFNQGDLMGYTGCAGNTGGMHSHWILGRGQFSSMAYCSDSKNTGFISGNPVDIDDLFYANGTQITSNGQTTTHDGVTCTWKLYTCGSTPTTDTYTLTLKVSGNGTVSGGGSYAKGSKVTIKAIPNSGATFTKWSDNNTSATRTITLNSNTTLTAYFTGTTPTPSEDEYTVTLYVSPSEGGYTSGQGTYKSGERAWLYAYANEGWKFTKWSDGYTYKDRYWDIYKDLTLTAYFEEIWYTVSGGVYDDKGNSNVGGTISGLGSYKYGSSCTINITADRLYVIDSIKVNGSEILSDNEKGKKTSYTYNINGIYQDYNIVVIFRKKGILINGYGGIDFQIL